MRFLAVFLLGPLFAGEMPVSQQNALVAEYCLGCHTDKAASGGLSLQHFDAARPDPGLAAMMLNKLQNGALGASGLKRPDEATSDAFREAFAAGAKGFHGWTAAAENGQGTLVAASIVYEIPKVRDAGLPALYRLKLVCDTASREGSVQLAWSPTPKDGEWTVWSDGGAATRYPVTVKDNNAAAILLKLANGLPTNKLTASGLFEGETIDFGFANMPPDMRAGLSACFATTTASSQ